ncbi:hypothetical protein [Lapidilactobacillus wuchangensis]|uniref:hypothetical protein n=1 Tax=Lapidilactobacillus wuchangensis TaxID=2486001 RepID=UPI0013DDDDB0|nr:hypothetical protein [Lapidilactobacillus wuchangensis]
MKRLINRFGYPRMKWIMIITTIILTVAFGLTIFMTVKTFQNLNSWVTFTMN